MHIYEPIHYAIRCAIRLIVYIFAIGLTSPCLSQTDPVTAIALMPNGQLVLGSDRGLQVHDIATLKPRKEIETEIEKIYAIESSPDGKRVAIAGGTPADLGVVEIFQLPGFEPLQKFEPFDDIATDIAWKSNEQLVACSMSGNGCNLQLGKTKPVPFNVHSKGILALEVLADGQIVSAGLDASIRVWRPDEAKKARVLNNHINTVNHVSLRPRLNNQTVLSMIASASDDKTIRFWQPTIGRMVRFVRLDSTPNCVVWNSDGSQAIAGCQDGSIRIVDPETAKVVRTIQGNSWIHCLALDVNNGNLFAGHQDGISRVKFSSSD